MEASRPASTAHQELSGKDSGDSTLMRARVMSGDGGGGEDTGSVDLLTVALDPGALGPPAGLPRAVPSASPYPLCSQALAALWHLVSLLLRSPPREENLDC